MLPKLTGSDISWKFLDLVRVFWGYCLKLIKICLFGSRYCSGSSGSCWEIWELLSIVLVLSNLNRTHIQEIMKKKAYKMGFLMGTCKDFKDIKSHVLLFNSFVNSQLNYCTVAWKVHWPSWRYPNEIQFCMISFHVGKPLTLLRNK